MYDGYTINRYGYPVPNDKIHMCETEFPQKELDERKSSNSTKLIDKIMSYLNNIKKFTSQLII